MKKRYSLIGGSANDNKDIFRTNLIRSKQKITGRDLFKLIQATNYFYHEFYLESDGKKFFMKSSVKVSN